MAAAGSTALADETGRGGSVETFNDDGTASFANSQNVRDAPAPQMTGWWGRFGSVPEAPEELPQGLHKNSMNKFKSGCNQSKPTA